MHTNMQLLACGFSIPSLLKSPDQDFHGHSSIIRTFTLVCYVLRIDLTLLGQIFARPDNGGGFNTAMSFDYQRTCRLLEAWLLGLFVILGSYLLVRSEVFHYHIFSACRTARSISTWGTGDVERLAPGSHRYHLGFFSMTAG